VVGAGRYERAGEPVGDGRGPAAAETPAQAVVARRVVMSPTPKPLIEYRAEVPEPVAFVRLFSTTGWDPQGRLTVAAAAEALAPTWYAVSAYAGDRLVGTGRIIGDGVLHALLVDVIVDPAYRHLGLGSVIVERLVAECRRHRIVDVQLFCAQGVRPFYARLGFAARPDDAPGMELVAG
jgi:GNAT superfamily N-acetyltransferase